MLMFLCRTSAAARLGAGLQATSHLAGWMPKLASARNTSSRVVITKRPPVKRMSAVTSATTNDGGTNACNASSEVH